MNRPQEALPKAADMVKTAGDLVQVIITQAKPLEFRFFKNGQILAVIGHDLKIGLDYDPSKEVPVCTASLSYQKGEGTEEINLFPGIVEITGLGRRITVGCESQEDFLVTISLGLLKNGTSRTIDSGLKALQVVLSDNFISAQLIWLDGEKEELFPAVV